MSRIHANTKAIEPNMLIIEDEFDAKIKPELDRRVHLMTASVVGSFLTGDNPNETSFRHVLNRVMVLLQMSITFLIFEKIGGRYMGRYMFNRHPRDREEIKRCVWGQRADGTRYKNDEGKERNLLSPFQLFGTQYYLFAVVIGKKKGKHNFYPLFSNEKDSRPSTANDLAAYQLEKILSAKSYESYGGRIYEKLEASIKACCRENDSIHSWELGKRVQDVQVEDTQISKRSIEPKLLLDVEHHMRVMLLENKDPLLLPNMRENGYMDRVFRKIGSNLDLISGLSNQAKSSKTRIGEYSDKRPANYVIFLRDYGAGTNYKRHASSTDPGYDYRVRIAIADKQKKDIWQYFHYLKSIKKTLIKKEEGISHPTVFQDSLDKRYAAEHQAYKFLALDLDRYFWDMLDRFENKLVDDSEGYLKDKSFIEFIDILSAPFGEKTRSACDLVFDGGVSHFRRPFADGGISRCFPGDTVENFPHSLAEVRERRDELGEIERDLKRLVISSYWYQGMVSIEDTKTNELGMMMVPIEIGHKIWCVIGYFTPLYIVQEESEKDERPIDHQKPDGHEPNQQYKKKLHFASNCATWSINYHVFHDVHTRIRKDLRNSVANCHRDLHAYYYFQLGSPKNLIQLVPKEQARWLREQNIQNWLNERYEAITAFFSYDQVQVSVVDGMATPSGFALAFYEGDEVEEGKPTVDKGVFLTLDRGCAINRSKDGEKIRTRNHFFPEAPGNSDGAAGKVYNYVNEQDLSIRLTNAMVNRIWQRAFVDATADQG